MRITWTPPGGGDPLVFGDDAPYFLIELAGLEPTQARPVTTRGPRQSGSTLRDVTVGERTVALTVLVRASSLAELWGLRAELARACAVEPRPDPSDPTPGLLTVERDGMEALEIEAVPTVGPKLSPTGPLSVEADLEFFCADPYWREQADAGFTLGTQGGLQLPITLPMEIASFNVGREIDNGGDVRTPMLARIYGDITDPSLTNALTGEVLAFTGRIPPGDYLEVWTGYGQKSVTYVTADGTRTGAMGRVNLSSAKFWQLRPGTQTVALGSSLNAGGYAVIFWRQRYAGV